MILVFQTTTRTNGGLADDLSVASSAISWSLLLREECKSKPLSLLGGLMRRTASLDAIYLSAQWPRDLHSYCGRPMVDRATQTSDDWKEVDRIKYVQKKTTLASGDSLEMKYIRQRLQRTATQGGRTSPRWSPVQGDHQLGGLAQQQQAHLASPSTSPFAAPGNPTGPISIPARSGPGRGSALPRMRSSVEGLNQAMLPLSRSRQPDSDEHRSPQSSERTSVGDATRTTADTHH
ncbi:glucocorticoid-induced transcript 1 protein [Ixodes scapularis]